jgi:hypothetical protein
MFGCRTLEVLQDQVEPGPVEDVAEVLQRELGAPASQLFAEFEPEARAAASLAQVLPHACLHGCLPMCTSYCHMQPCTACTIDKHRTHKSTMSELSASTTSVSQSLEDRTCVLEYGTYISNFNTARVCMCVVQSLQHLCIPVACDATHIQRLQRLHRSWSDTTLMV